MKAILPLLLTCITGTSCYFIGLHYGKKATIDKAIQGKLEEFNAEKRQSDSLQAKINASQRFIDSMVIEVSYNNSKVNELLNRLQR